MKTLKSLIIPVISFALIFSCSKNESVQTAPKETITLEGGLDINFDDLTVVTLDGEGDVDEDGGFDVNTTSTTTEDLPILFTKEEDVMFGYYSKTGANNTVSIDDILLLYFNAHPEVAIQGLSNSILLGKIKSSTDYLELKNLITTSLESNISPFDNNNFVELLNNSGYSLALEVSSSKQSKTKKGGAPFSYSFTRDGNVTWIKEFPLYATVGMEIVDENGNSMQRYLFEKDGLVASPGSLVSWVWNLIVDEVEGKTESYQFTNSGTYDIVFTNGVDNIGSSELEKDVDYSNRLGLAVDVISITSPIATKHLFKKIDSDCLKEIIKIFEDLKLEPLKLAAGEKFQLDTYIKSLSNNVYNVSKKCVPEANLAFLDVINSMQKYFSLAEDTAELTLFIRDYLLSDIHGKETRYFYNDISYGKLFLSNLSGSNNGVPEAQNEFVGEPESEHVFEGELTEETFNYEIERGFTSTITQSDPPQSKPVENFPFIAEQLIGDAFQVTNMSPTPPTITNSEGKLEMTFKMGTIDSKFEIKPNFEGKGLPEIESINFVNKVNILGIWKITGSDDCTNSDGTKFSDSFMDGTVIINEDGTVTLNNDSNGIYIYNSWTFDGNELVISVSYDDISTNSCGTISQRKEDLTTFTYDQANEIFNGTGVSSGQYASNGGCESLAYTCNSTASLKR